MKSFTEIPIKLAHTKYENKEKYRGLTGWS